MQCTSHDYVESELVADVSDEDVSGGTITHVIQDGDTVRVNYWSPRRLRHRSLVFHRVSELSAQRVVGWSFATVIEERFESSWRRYTFTSGVGPIDETIPFTTPRQSTLVIVARDMTQEQMQVSRLRGYWWVNEAQRRDLGAGYWGVSLAVLGVLAAILGSFVLILLALYVLVRGTMEVFGPVF